MCCDDDGEGVRSVYVGKYRYRMCENENKRVRVEKRE